MIVLIKDKKIDGYEVYFSSPVQSNSEEFVLVPVKAYKELALDCRKYHALQASGVDNWQWYEDALQEIWDEE